MERRHHHLTEAHKTLVDRRVEEWRRQHADTRDKPEPPPRPIVTISREPGAGGEELARRVADELGYELWDRNLVHEIAQREGARDALIASLDEHVQSRLEEFVDGFVLPNGTMSEFLRQLAIVIGGLERKGSAVIVGRGSQFLARNTNALRVRVVSPLKVRVQRIAERHELGEKEAAAEVTNLERERKSFYSRYFGQAESDPTLYDVVVNPGVLGLDAASQLVVAAYRVKLKR